MLGPRRILERDGHLLDHGAGDDRDDRRGPGSRSRGGLTPGDCCSVVTMPLRNTAPRPGSRAELKVRTKLCLCLADRDPSSSPLGDEGFSEGLGHSPTCPLWRGCPCWHRARDGTRNQHFLTCSGGKSHRGGDGDGQRYAFDPAHADDSSRGLSLAEEPPETNQTVARPPALLKRGSAASTSRIRFPVAQVNEPPALSQPSVNRSSAAVRTSMSIAASCASYARAYRGHASSPQLLLLLTDETATQRPIQFQTPSRAA